MAGKGGARSVGKHVSELGMGGVLASLAVSFLPEDSGLSAFQLALLVSALTGGFSTVAKIMDAKGWLGNVTKTGLVVLLATTMSGCAFQVGKVDPLFITGADGETIMACKLRGISVALGDGAVCRDTTEGGELSQGFTHMIEAMFNGTARIVGGMFGGMSAAITPAEDS